MKNEVGVLFRSILNKWELVYSDGSFFELTNDDSVFLLIDNTWTPFKVSNLDLSKNGTAAKIMKEI